MSINDKKHIGNVKLGGLAYLGKMTIFLNIFLLTAMSLFRPRPYGTILYVQIHFSTPIGAGIRKYKANTK